VSYSDIVSILAIAMSIVGLVVIFYVPPLKREMRPTRITVAGCVVLILTAISCLVHAGVQMSDGVGVAWVIISYVCAVIWAYHVWDRNPWKHIWCKEECDVQADE
jgi:amino acid transporter